MRRLGIFHPSIALFFFPLLVAFLALSAPDIRAEENHGGPLALRGEGTGEKIAGRAEAFVGTPYDRDPQGIYVTRQAIVADDAVDCMYLTFRAVELALSRTPEEAIQVALDKRFHTKGILRDGKVANYDDRFEYGEDMIESGKWGKDITGQIGRTARIRGSRSYAAYEVLPPHEVLRRKKLATGDILFFFKDPEKRVVGEGVGHIGIVKLEGKDSEKKVLMIHAGGTKSSGGKVKKASLKDYLEKMPFIGVKVTRFE